MRTAEDVLRFKGSTVWSVSPRDTVLHALGLMAEHDIGAVLVLEGDVPVGILSERDYARKVVLAGRSSRDSAIADVMTREVICVAPERSVDECLELMTRKRVRHLPVVAGKRVTGMISIGDLVREQIEEQIQTIEHLQHYIAG